MTGGEHDGCHDSSGRLVRPGFGIPASWIVEPDRDRPELTVHQLRSGTYDQAARVIGDQEHHAVLPFPVSIVPSDLVTPG